MTPVEEKDGKPFYERPWFKGAAAVVALVSATIALVRILGDTADDIIPEPTQRTAWAEVVLNTSAIMGERFGDGSETALQSAKKALRKYVKELDNFGVGLRRTPVSCEEDSEKLIDVTKGNPEEVVDRAEGLQPEGSASIVDAILGGLREFEREPMQRQKAKNKKLLVLTTDSPPCELDELVEEEARSRLKKIDEIGTVEVFALQSRTAAQTVSFNGFAAEGSSELDLLEEALGPKMEIHYVETPAQLQGEAEAVGEAAQEEAEEPNDGTSDEAGPQ